VGSALAQGQRPIRPLRDFLRTESAGGALLVAAAIVALIWANSPWKAGYEALWSTVASIDIGGHGLSLDLRGWVNDGLMTLFFFVVGLEIKRELTSGHLADRRAAMLPALAAVGGMVAPALVYLAIAGRDSPRGWGIPMATDIALAIGVASLLGDRVPSGLRTFLLALAIVDDIGAILVIAIFYSDGTDFAWLAIAFVAVAAVLVAKRCRVPFVGVYALLGVIGWFALHEAGVHPTLMGVAMGLIAPSVPFLRSELVDAEELADVSSVEAVNTTVTTARHSVSVVEWLEFRLHGWVSYAVVPVFALANAGVPVGADALGDALTSPLGVGIIAGLVVGKLVGIVGVTMLAVRLGWGRLPDGATNRSLVGVALLAGIGFTVALFVAELAVGPRSPGGEAVGSSPLATAKLAVLLASVLAAGLGVAVLWGARRSAPTPESELSSVTRPRSPW